MKNTFFAALLSAAVLCPVTAQTIQTIAGGGPLNLSSLATGLAQPSGAAVDSAGNLYVSLSQLNQIWKFTPSGSTSVFAGNGSFPYDGDNIPALTATLLQPSGLAFDTAGNLFVADSGHNRVRMISTSGVITTVAGTGVAGFSGDGGAATAAQLHDPTSVAVDRNNVLYIVDAANNVVRAVSSGVINPFAGSGASNGESIPATSAALNSPNGVAVDSALTVYISDSGNFRVRKVVNGLITTVAGNGTAGSSGNGGSPTMAQLNFLAGVSVGPNDQLYIIEANDIRTIAYSMLILYAGTGTPGYSGDGGVPNMATFNGLAAFPFIPGPASGSSVGYAVDAGNKRIRKITGSVVTTFAGNGSVDYNGDALPALHASLLTPNYVAVDNGGSLYFTDGGSSSIRKVTLSNNLLSTPVGSGVPGITNDGQPGAGNSVTNPYALSFGPGGSLLFAEINRVRKVTGGVLSTVVDASNVLGAQGDGGNASAAQLNLPSGLALASNGDLYVADSSNNRVRLVNGQTGIITTIAGTGTASSTGDGGLATGATLNNPSALALDGTGNLFVAELLGNRVRKIALSSNIISTAAGDGTSNFADNVPATSTGLSVPFSIFADESGNLFIADEGHYRVRKVAVGTNIISTVAGNGTNDFAGDGGAATAAAINPLGIAIDRSQNLYIADGSGRIRSTTVTACFFTPSSLTQNFSNTSGTGSITVAATNSSCPYTVATNASFITVTSTTSGSGSSTVAFSVAANTGPASRSGIITIGAQTITVNQNGPAVTTADSISPNAGSGTAQTFAAVFSSTSGAGNLASEQIIINNALSNSSGCSIYVNSSGFFLFNDAGSSLAGPAQSGTLSNSQCSLSVSGSSVSSSGNSRTVSVSLAFTQAFVGAKTLYLSASDASGNSSGFQNRGNYTVTQMSTAPTADSVSPNAGSGSTQVFNAIYSDPSGNGNITAVQMLINSSLSNTNACSVYVDHFSFYLFNDGGALIGPVSPGGTLSNSQCTLSGSGSSILNSGTSRTVTFSLGFNASFAGTKNIYLYGANASGNNSGFQNRGTYSVSSTGVAPSAGSVSPNSGYGRSQYFTATYSDASGYANIASEQFLINSSLSNINACSLYVNSSGFYLFNDAGNVLLGPAAQGATLSNSQCTFSQTGSSVYGYGTDRTVMFNLSFSNSFSGVKSLYSYATDMNSRNSGFQNRGTFSVPQPGSVPTSDSISPSSGSSFSQSFTATYSDPSGYGSLASEQLLINSSLSNTNACSMYVNSSGFYLFNDAGTNLIGPATQGGALSNSQCTFYQSGSSLTGSGNTRNVVFNLVFSSSFVGAKTLYLYTTNTFGNNSGFQNRGMYSVPTSSAPTADSVAPNYSAGTSQAFYAVYSDPHGYANLVSEQLIVNSPLSNSNGCSLYVNGSGFFLFNDAGTVLIGPAAPGGTLSNSQCTFFQNGSSVSGSGNSRTVVYNLGFSTTFRGAKGLYSMAANSISNSGFQDLGTFNVN